MKRTLPLVLLVLMILAAGTAQGGSDSHLELKAVAEIEVEIVNAQGEKEIRRMEASRVVPGDEVIYTVYFTNVGQDPADDVSITNPVPEHMQVRDINTDGPTRVVISIDGGHQFDFPENLKVLRDDGTERPALPSEYTHIRWTLPQPVQPGEKGSVSFHAQLL